MASEDFVMVVPPGWIEIENADDLIAAWPGGEIEIQDYIARKSWGQIDSLLDDNGVLPAGMTTEEARLFSTGDEGGSPRLWVKLMAI